MTFRIFLTLTLSILLFACKKEEKQEGNSTPTDYRRSLWVSNEGAFGQGNAELSLIHADGSMDNQAFIRVNGYEPGDVMQSVHTGAQYAYLVMNNSQKIIVVDQESLLAETVIAPCSYPRYVLELNNNKAYISNGSMEGELLILDLQSMSISGSIPVGNGPERMLSYGDLVYVVNTGGWLSDNSISRVSMTSDAELNRISLSDRPIDMELSNDDALWVMCAGNTIYDENWNITGHSNASLWKLDASTGAILGDWQLGENGDHPGSMALSSDGNLLYYTLDGSIWTASTAVPDQQELFSSDASADVIACDPATGNVWVCDITDYSSNGRILKLSPTGEILSVHQSGIAPNELSFGANW